MPLNDDKRRAPAVHRKIENVSEEDIRVSVIGTVVDKGESRVAVDDGTGTIEVVFDLSKDLDGFDESDLVRVVGRPSDGSMDGEVIQNFEGFDVDLYEEILEKLGEFRS